MLQRTIFQLIIGLLTGSVLSATAQTPPPAPAHALSGFKANLDHAPFAHLQMGGLRVEFEKTSLGDVRHAAAAGEIAHQGDAGTSVYWLCYTDGAGNSAQRIWLLSDGEMGGSRHAITGVRAQALSQAQPTPDCPALPARLRRVSLDKPVWLGSPEIDSRAVAAHASQSRGAWRSFDYQGKISGNCQGGRFDRTSRLLLHFRKGQVDSLEAEQVTSC